MTISLAFSGAGYIANIHATALQSVPEARITALVDFRPQDTLAFRKKFHIDAVFTTIEELVASSQVDGIIICTPNPLHAPQTIKAMQSGLHVFVEKPMALNANQAREMRQAAAVNNRALMVGHCWRFDEEAQWLKAQIDAGKLGKLIRTRGYGIHTHWGPVGWFQQRELSGGGALVDMGIHAVDTARYLMGDPKPTSVYAKIGTHFIEGDVDDTGVLMITWETGAFSTVEFGWWQPHKDGPEAGTGVYGTRGYGNLFPTLLELPNPEKQRVETKDPGFKYPRKEHCPLAMYTRQMRHFITAIQEHQTPVPGGEEGWINMTILDAAYRSAESGQVEEIVC